MAMRSSAWMRGVSRPPPSICPSVQVTMPELHLKYLQGVSLSLYDTVILMDTASDRSRHLFERENRTDQPTLVVLVQDVEDAMLAEYVKIELDPYNKVRGWKI